MFNGLKKIHLLILAAIIIVFFLSRITNLSNYPIFTDEAIYLRWAQIAKNDAAWRFISLTDGKQPLYIWLTIGVMKIIADPIIAGRLVSVFSGAGTIIALFLLGKLVFAKWEIGLLAAFFYLISPFSFVYDRIALMDGTLACIMTWALLFEFLLIKTRRLDVALLLGGIIGFAALTKTSGFIALYLFPFMFILLEYKEKSFLRDLLKMFLFYLVIIAVCQLFYAVLRLSPFFHIIGQKDQTFVYSFSDWLKNPMANVEGKLKGLLGWAIQYLTIPFLLLTLSGIFAGWKFFRERIIIFCWFLVPLTGLALLGKIIYPRFIFFMTVPLFLLAAYSLLYFGRFVKIKYFWVVLLLLVSVMPFLLTNQLFVDPTQAKIPRPDANQYFNDWPSGYGIKESIAFLQKESIDKKITVYTEGTFGLLPAGLEMYLTTNKNVTIIGIWPVPEKIPSDILATAKREPTFIIFFQNSPSPDWPLTEIFRVKKGSADRYHYLYLIDPNKK